MNVRAIGAGPVLALCVAGGAVGQSPAAIDPAAAGAVFDEARTLCEAEGGRLWGRSLCGPIMLVDPETRAVVANQADAEGRLSPAGAVFTGVLPHDAIISNTSMTWSGTFWTQMMWPLTADENARRVLISHEQFHRIWRDLGFPKLAGGDNQHLDTLEGRYLMQLEWRALARALTASTPAEARAATTDVLIFRAERYRRFPDAAAEEHALEINEGVAEYTGVAAGLSDPEARVDFALKDLSTHVADATFVRSFAYATGPAWGLLLDAADPEWRGKVVAGARFDDLLRTAGGITLPADLGAAARTRARAYDEGALRAAEEAREAARLRQQAVYRAALVDGPVLVLPLDKFTRQFRPPTLVPLGDEGVVYPTMRLTDAWGVLEVSGGPGALLRKDMKQATVSVVGADPAGLAGDGWTLALKPGWVVKAGARPGDLLVAPDR